MKSWTRAILAAVAGTALVAGASSAGSHKGNRKSPESQSVKQNGDDSGGDDEDDNQGGSQLVFHAGLHGFQVVPAVSTTGTGRISLTVSPDGTSIGYSLSYSGLVGDVTAAHLHFGRTATNGGIMVFLCTNLGDGPVGTPTCPGPHDGQVSGTLQASAVVGPSAQGIDPGELPEVLAALRGHSAYADVHTMLYPDGEIRGRL